MSCVNDNEFRTIFPLNACRLLRSYSWARLKPLTCILWLRVVILPTCPPPSPAALAAGGARSKDLVLSLLVSCCCSCRWNSLWPLPLPALIPDLQSLGSSSEARSQHHGNPTSLSNHRLVWQRQHCRQEWVGQKSRVAATLRYTVWEWTAAVSLRGLATQMCTTQFLPLPCRSGRRGGKGGAGEGMPVRLEELRLRVSSLK